MKRAGLLLLGGLLALLTSCSFSTATPTSPAQSSTPPVQPSAVEAVTPSLPVTPSPTLPAQASATAIPTTAEATPTASATPSNEISATSSPPPAASPTASPTPSNGSSSAGSSALTATPTTPPAETAAPNTSSAGCTNIASYYGDVTIPDGTTFRQGESFVKTWRIRNEGTCTWDASYSLVFAGGEVMNADLANAIPEVPPETVADISVELTAPSRGGTYQSNWELQSGPGERFGVGTGGPGLLWAQIAVSFVVPTSAAPASGSQPAESGCAATRDTAVEQQVLDLINEARQNQWLAALEPQEQLAAAALEHSMDMACNNFVDHAGSDGSLWYDRVSAQGYANYNSARENIYVGNPQFGGTAEGAFNWWWNSKIHHDNMLYPDVSQIGIGYVFDPDSEYGGYYTTVFARP